jgi:putative hydrolase of the HAD superfamily
MTPQFLYFDMGNVLLRFSHEREAEQMARVIGVAPERAWQIVFDEGLHWQFERGEITEDEFYDRFLKQAGLDPGDPTLDRAALDLAANDIFELNVPIVPLCGHLVMAGYRLGVLSNTSAPHWRHCTARFSMLTTLFSVHAVSFRLGAMKPDRLAFERAAELAGARPEDIFFTDDRDENVAAAREVGYDAVLFESVSQLNEALRQRGVRINL